MEEKHKSPEQVIIMIITTRWSDHIEENNINQKQVCYLSIIVMLF